MSNKKSPLEAHGLDVIDEKLLSDFASALAPIIGAFFQFLMDRWGIKDPIEVLKECIVNEDWFKGIVLSTAFFEGIGRKILTVHFKDRIKPERIEHLRLEQLIIFLYASGLINQSTYSKMLDIKEYRNKLVHLEPFTDLKIQPKKAKRMIRKAIKCLKPLIEKLAEIEEEINPIIELPPKPNEQKER